MHALPPLITDLTLIAVYAGIITLVFKWLKQPVVLGYVLAGIIAGPYLTLFPSVTDEQNIKIWADIGVIFLLFSLGLEFSFKKILNVGKTAIITGMMNIIFLLFIGYLTGQILGWSTMNSLFLGGMISMSSTTIIIKAFEELNLKKMKFTDLVFGVLIIEDIVGILLLVLLPTVALSQSVNGNELLISTLKLLFFLVLCFITGIYLIPTFMKKASSYMNDETLLIVSIGLCLAMVLFATSSGFSSALGAFIMGAILAESNQVKRIEHVLKPVKDFFGAVFFVSVGMMVNPLMFIKYAEPILYISAIVIIGKVFFSCIGFVISGQTPRTAVLCGFSLAQVGEFAFIIASLGLSLGVLADHVYPTIVAVSVLTTFTTPLMIKSAIPFYNKARELLPHNLKEIIKRTLIQTNENKEEDNSAWNELFKRYFLRISLFSIILIGIMNISFHLVSPLFHKIFPDLIARILITTITLVCMAPFMNALLVLKGKFSRIYIDLWIEKQANRAPLLMLTAFKVLIVALFVMIVIHELLTANPYVTTILVTLTLFLALKSQWVSEQYMKIEAHFLINLNREQIEQQIKENEDKNIKPKEWLDSSLEVLTLVLTSEAPWVGKELKETEFRDKYGMNIFKIIRGDQIITIPRSNEKLFEGDELTFVGTPKQLKRFKTNNQSNGIKIKEPDNSLILHDYILNQKGEEDTKDKTVLISCAFLVTPESGLAQHNIVDAQIRNKTKCLVIGVERKSSLFVNPESNFTFKEGDLIWLLGDKKSMTQEVLHQMELNEKNHTSKQAENILSNQAI
ncbi:MAG: cation:proton antiporter [Alphaproteobacteria bacterium]|nr:cation:proton antiporter [Alphaproteobacteria bacterium]